MRYAEEWGPRSTTAELIVVCGASGKIGSHIIPFLYGKHRLRLIVHSFGSFRRMQTQYPRAEVLQADMTQPKDCKKIVGGATFVYHTAPTFHPQETQMGNNMIDAAVDEVRKGNFRHFIYSSAIQTQLRKLPNHDCKRYVEEYLMESGLSWTILQPTHFLDMARFAPLLRQEKPILYAGFDPNVPFSFLSLEDYGEASAKVIVEGEKHAYAQYPLVSTFPMTYVELIGAFGKEIGKIIDIERRTLEDAVKGLMKALYGSSRAGPANENARDALERMLLYYNRRGLAGNPQMLEFLLGRKATSVHEWIHVQVEKSMLGG